MKGEPENEEEPIEESFRGDLKRLGRWLAYKRKAIIIVCLWTAVISGVIVWEYYSLYANNPFLETGGYIQAFAPTDYGYIPKLYTLDYVVILVASLLAGYVIADVEDTLFGFLISSFLSTVISVAYSTFFIWYVLGFFRIVNSSFISEIVWAASLNIFRMIFPLGLLAVFLGGLFGAFLRGYIQPSATD